MTFFEDHPTLDDLELKLLGQLAGQDLDEVEIHLLTCKCCKDMEQKLEVQFKIALQAKNIV